MRVPSVLCLTAMSAFIVNAAGCGGSTKRSAATDSGGNSPLGTGDVGVGGRGGAGTGGSGGAGTGDSGGFGGAGQRGFGCGSEHAICTGKSQQMLQND
jgi:hypothetical protein